MGASDITYIGMIWAILLLIPVFLINYLFDLKQFKPYVVAAIRMIAQLAFVGVYLHYIFEWNKLLGQFFVFSCDDFYCCLSVN